MEKKDDGKKDIHALGVNTDAIQRNVKLWQRKRCCLCLAVLSCSFSTKVLK
jgi:hypothetical protein